MFLFIGGMVAYGVADFGALFCEWCGGLNGVLFCEWRGESVSGVGECVGAVSL